MAIAYGEYGPYDTLTGEPVFNVGGESGFVWSTAGNEAVAGRIVDPNEGGVAWDPRSGTPHPAGTTEFSNYTLGPATYQDGYIVRGDYRMPIQQVAKQGGGLLEYRDASGVWKPVSGGLDGYDARQDSNTQGSNERLSFDWAFANAPEGVDVRNLQKIALSAGWTEPDRSRNEGTFGSFLEAAVPGVLAVLGVGWAANAGMLGAMGGAEAGAATAASTEAANLAAADAMAGLIPADTGGWLVGSNGLISGTGNAIGDAVLNNAGQSVLKSTVTGEDPLKAAVTGAAGGLISSSGVLNDVSAAITPDDAGQVATNAISRGVNAAGTNLLTTGDLGTAAEAGLISGIGNYVGGTVAGAGAPPVVAGAAGGGAAGVTNAVLQDTDIGTGLITGAAGGGASGLASQLGANSTVANTIGSVVGGVVGSELADDQTAAGPAPVGTPALTPTPFAGMTFADMLPAEFVNVKATRETDWGSRLTNARSMT